VTLVFTQFGAHLVEITDRKYIDNDQGVKLAFLIEPIIPSEETQASIYDDAQEFSGNNRTVEALRKAVEANPELSIETAQGLTANGYQFSTLGSGGTSRDIIRWAFDPDTRVGQVAPEAFVYDEPTLFYNARYVVAALRSIVKPGTSTLDEVKEYFKCQVMQRKKGEMLAAAMAGKDLQMVASEYGVVIDS